MSYFERANNNCKELEKFIYKINKCPEAKISYLINQNNINIYNDKINELFNIFVIIPINNDQDTKNFNLKLLNCLNKTISFFLSYYEINFRINRLDLKNILCKSVIENILEKFMHNKNSEKIFTSILKNIKFYFMKQNYNYEETIQVCGYLEAINILFKHLINTNELFFGKVNITNLLSLKEKFDEINRIFTDKKNSLEKKKIEEKESRFKVRLEQLKLQLEESENFFSNLLFEKNKNINPIYKEPEIETIATIGLKNLDISESLEAPAIPSFDNDFFLRELMCIEEFKSNKKNVENFKKNE